LIYVAQGLPSRVYFGFNFVFRRNGAVGVQDWGIGWFGLGEFRGLCAHGCVLRSFRDQVQVHYHMKISIKLSFLTTLLFAVFANTSQACTVCMGGNGTLGEAANGAIFVMLGVLAFVLGLIVMAGYSVVKRGRLPLPPHAELARAMSNSN